MSLVQAVDWVKVRKLVRREEIGCHESVTDDAWRKASSLC
jgi:hypothetical protein